MREVHTVQYEVGSRADGTLQRFDSKDDAARYEAMLSLRNILRDAGLSSDDLDDVTESLVAKANAVITILSAVAEATRQRAVDLSQKMELVDSASDDLYLDVQRREHAVLCRLASNLEDALREQGAPDDV